MANIESEAAMKARHEAAAKPKATVDATDTEAVKDLIRTHVTTVGGAKIAGFGPTSTSATSGIHSHPDAFHRRKGVVNTMGGAKDVSRSSREEPVRLPPRAPGDKAPGARVGTIGGLDSHAAEGKAKRAAAEAKMRSSSASATSRAGGGGGGGATIAGFNKHGGVALVKAGSAGRMGGGGGAPVSAAAHHAPAAAASAPTSHRSTGGAGFTGGSGVVGGSSAHGGVGASAADSTGDAARRAAYFRKMMAEKAAATETAMATLSGDTGAATVAAGDGKA